MAWPPPGRGARAFPLPPLLQLQLDIGNLRDALEEEREAAARAGQAPGKARRAADAAAAALRALRDEEGEVAAALRAAEAAEGAALQEAREAGQQHAAAARACDKLRNQLAVSRGLAGSGALSRGRGIPDQLPQCSTASAAC